MTEVSYDETPHTLSRRGDARDEFAHQRAPRRNPVSIAHRPGLDVFHDRTLTLVEAVEGARVVTKRKPYSVNKGQRRRKLPFAKMFRALDSARLL
jgi:hypothetical protein